MKTTFQGLLIFLIIISKSLVLNFQKSISTLSSVGLVDLSIKCTLTIGYKKDLNCTSLEILLFLVSYNIPHFTLTGVALLQSHNKDCLKLFVSLIISFFIVCLLLFVSYLICKFAMAKWKGSI